MLLDVRDLRVEFRTRDGVARAVNGVSYAVDMRRDARRARRVRLGQVRHRAGGHGNPGLAPGRITGGEVFFQGRDLLKLKEERRRRIRGAEMAMIFQDALSALNPVLSVGTQLGEMFVVHRGMSADRRGREPSS